MEMDCLSFFGVSCLALTTDPFQPQAPRLLIVHIYWVSVCRRCHVSMAWGASKAIVCMCVSDLKHAMYAAVFAAFAA